MDDDSILEQIRKNLIEAVGAYPEDTDEATTSSVRRTRPLVGRSGGTLRHRSSIHPVGRLVLPGGPDLVHRHHFSLFRRSQSSRTSWRSRQCARTSSSLRCCDMGDVQTKVMPSDTHVKADDLIKTTLEPGVFRVTRELNDSFVFVESTMWVSTKENGKQKRARRKVETPINRGSITEIRRAV